MLHSICKLRWIACRCDGMANVLVGSIESIFLCIWRVRWISWCFLLGCNPSAPWFDSRHLFHRSFLFFQKENPWTGAGSKLLCFRLESKDGAVSRLCEKASRGEELLLGTHSCGATPQDLLCYFRNSQKVYTSCKEESTLAFCGFAQKDLVTRDRSGTCSIGVSFFLIDV